MAHGISAAFGKLGALISSIAFHYTDDVQIFMISGYTSLLACIITLWFIPESSQLDLFELDKKWHLITAGKIQEYSGPANYPQFSSFHERNLLHIDISE